MYIPKIFEVSDRDEIFSFIESHSFGQLISNVKGRPFSTHMPFLMSQNRKTLLGHLAKQNQQHVDIEGQEVLVSLQGPHDYISPSWYSSPGVPTWNYQSVHIYGFCRIFTDQFKLKDIVENLTEKYESRFSEPSKPVYQEEMLKAIVGIEIEISEIQCKYKLSQNKKEKDRANVTKHLKSMGSHKLADAMNKITS